VPEQKDAAQNVVTEIAGKVIARERRLLAILTNE
jgi:hypothetical protein